jgi:hypothetical protein
MSELEPREEDLPPKPPLDVPADVDDLEPPPPADVPDRDFMRPADAADDPRVDDAEDDR